MQKLIIAVLKIALYYFMHSYVFTQNDINIKNNNCKPNRELKNKKQKKPQKGEGQRDIRIDVSLPERSVFIVVQNAKEKLLLL